MDDFINIIEKDPQVQVKIGDAVDEHPKLSYNYQPKIGYDTLIQNVIPKKKQ